MDGLCEGTRGALLAIIRQLENQPSRDDIERAALQLDQLCHHVVRLAGVGAMNDNVLGFIRQALASLRSYEDRDCQENILPVSYSGRRGRPSFVITREQLEYMLAYDFAATQISNILGVSLSTIRRRMRDYSLYSSNTYTLNLSDEQLDSIVGDLSLQFPNCGYRRLEGHLLARGIKVPQMRIRDTLRRVDPAGVASRWLRVIPRRTYSVRGPQALWHIDGNHKLIRWRCVIHGGVDGYTRIPVFLHCSTNNTADTVLQLFRQAVQQYGIPSRVRSDKGGENVGVSLFMLSHPLRGPGRGSMICGRSVHNQRIERLWRDVYVGVASLYYHLFYHLEDCGALNLTNPIHLFALHYVYIPRINRHLDLWKEGWVRHRIRTANNRTPMQLYIAGMLSQRTAPEDDFLEEDIEQHGIDWDGPLPQETDTIDSVEIPETPTVLSARDMEILVETIDPLKESNSYATDIYYATVQFIVEHYNAATP